MIRERDVSGMTNNEVIPSAYPDSVYSLEAAETDE